MKFKSYGVPLLICGDNPALPGGLSRIGRDLATLACTLPQFRVGYLGRGISNRRMFPFVLYDYPESGQWGEDYIQQVWEDFSDGDNGVILTTDDPSRRHWFANPTGLPERLQRFLGDGRNFQKWGYFPIDSAGVSRRGLPMGATDCIMRYDRVLAASEWGCSVMITSGRKDADWLPHGIQGVPFSPDVKAIREVIGWEKNDTHVGCVMANQARKDYPAAFECFASLRLKLGNKFKAWLHVDRLVNHWNVYALAAEYGINDCLEVTMDLSDEALALRYSACDCTILPSGGEGFGYPIAESMMCGTQCVVTDYAGGAELVDEDCRVKPVAYHVDTPHNVVRAINSGIAFHNAALGCIEAKQQDWEYDSEQTANRVKHLEWGSLRHMWERWLLEGIR